MNTTKEPMDNIFELMDKEYPWDSTYHSLRHIEEYAKLFADKMQKGEPQHSDYFTEKLETIKTHVLNLEMIVNVVLDGGRKGMKNDDSR